MRAFFTSMSSILALAFCSSASALEAPGLPWIYSSPANKMGGAVASGIAQTLVRRGFAANDPRIAQTVAAVGARVAPLAAAAGTGATWLSTVSRLSPWMTTGVFVYQGITWYYDIQGKTYLSPPGTVTSTPIFSDGIVQGQLCWGVGFDCFGSPQESLAFLFSTTKKQYPTATYGVPVLTQNSATQYTAVYNYSISELGLNNYSGTKVVTSHASNTTCPRGSGYSGSGSTPYGCVDVGLANSPYAGAQVVGVSPQEAYDNLPAQAKADKIAADLIAEIANRIWKDAASQPDYKGVPFSREKPVVPDDLVPQRDQHPGDWPKTVGLAEPVPVTGPSPVALPGSNPNETPPPAGSTKVDLGADPGTPPPTFEELPTDLMKPIKDVMAPWLSWQVPSHGATCPTWHAAPSVSGRVFAIDISGHCDIIEQYRMMIAGVALAGWVIAAFFIVLSA